MFGNGLEYSYHTVMILLSSSSSARKILLQRLRLQFDTYSPDVDETPLPDETVTETVRRLSIDKAHTASTLYPHHLIIACDQLLSVNKQILGKPLTHEHAVQQLKLCSGNLLHSYTALTLLNAQTEHQQTMIAEYQVQFRLLSTEVIENYLRLDQPYHCAGSIKAESLGICLFEWMRGDDPSALTGLPLIALTKMLENEGVYPLELKEDIR